MTHNIYIAENNSFMFPIQTLKTIRNMLGIIGLILSIPIFTLIIIPFF